MACTSAGHIFCAFALMLLAIEQKKTSTFNGDMLLEHFQMLLDELAAKLQKFI